MKTFSHSESSQYENADVETCWVNISDILKTSGDDNGYHIGIVHDSSYRVRADITLSFKEAIELKEDLSEYLERFNCSDL